MFVGSRDEARRFYRETWAKVSAGVALTPLESLVAQVIAAHPEYQARIANVDWASDQNVDAGSAANPFMHLALHIALAEQLQTDRPPGILSLYQRILLRVNEPHLADHYVMDCLSNALAAASRTGTMPDESAYLDCVRKQIR
jgi:Domain of unknown function (DUF1841)